MNNLVVLALIVAVATAAPSGKSSGTYSSAPIQGISYVQTALLTQPSLQMAALHPSAYAVDVDVDDDDDDDNANGYIAFAYAKKSRNSGEDDDDNDEGSNEGGNKKNKGKGSGEDDGHRGKGKGGSSEESENKGQKKGSGHDDDDDNNDKLKLTAGTILSTVPLWGTTAGLVSTGSQGAPLANTSVIHHTSPILSTQTGTLGLSPQAMPAVSGQTTWTTNGQNIAWPTDIAPLKATPSVSTQALHGTTTLSVPSVPAHTAWTATSAQNVARPSAITAAVPAQQASISWPSTSGQLQSTAYIQPALSKQQTTVYAAQPTVQTHAALLQPISVLNAVKHENVPSAQIVGTYSGLPAHSIHTVPHGAQLTAAAHPLNFLTAYSQQGLESHPAVSVSSGAHQKSGYTGRSNHN